MCHFIFKMPPEQAPVNFSHCRQSFCSGGASIYGLPFQDEFHSRLRFNHRGVVATASDSPEMNTSQFFITLAPTEDLQRRTTIFGKVIVLSVILFSQVVGNTIFNVLKIGESEVDGEEKPLCPIKILSVDILSMPFDTIEPRHPSIHHALPEHPTPKKVERGVKNKSLLSFSDEQETPQSFSSVQKVTVPAEKSQHSSPPSTTAAALSKFTVEEKDRLMKKKDTLVGGFTAEGTIKSAADS